MLILSTLFLHSAYAAPVIVAKTLGIPKVSQSYELSESLVETLQKEYSFDITLLIENPCADLACQQEKAKDASPLWLVQVVIADDKKSAEITLFDMEAQRVRNTKTVKGDSWEEVRAKLPTSLVKMGKRRFSKIKSETETSSPDSTQGEEATGESTTQEGSESAANDAVNTAEGVESTPEAVVPPLPAGKPFEGFRARAIGALGMYQYTQNAEESTEYISPDVALQTVIPDLRIAAEYWLPSNQIGFMAEAGIAPFGYKLGDASTIKTISNIRAGVAYHHPLGDNTSLEVGLAYHSTNGLGFRFADERTNVDALTQSIMGGALSVGVITRMANLDLRADISETFAPAPKQTRIRVYGEKLLSSLSGDMMLTAHGGLQCTMRHFGFEVQTETGNVFDLQVGLFGGAGVSF